MIGSRFFGGASSVALPRLRESAPPSFRRRPESSEIFRAKHSKQVLRASHELLDWIPAFAGMTAGEGDSSHVAGEAAIGTEILRAKRPKQALRASHELLDWIPAFAGMTGGRWRF